MCAHLSLSLPDAGWHLSHPGLAGVILSRIQQARDQVAEDSKQPKSGQPHLDDVHPQRSH